MQLSILCIRKEDFSMGNEDSKLAKQSTSEVPSADRKYLHAHENRISASVNKHTEVDTKTRRCSALTSGIKKTMENDNTRIDAKILNVRNMSPESLKRAQSMLLMVRHSHQCKQVSCTRSCKMGKNIWDHLKECKTLQPCRCHVIRRILTHYSMCKKRTCRLCGPIVDTVIWESVKTKSKEKRRTISKLFSQKEMGSDSTIEGVSSDTHTSTSPKKKQRKTEKGNFVNHGSPAKSRSPARSDQAQEIREQNGQ